MNLYIKSAGIVSGAGNNSSGEFPVVQDIDAASLMAKEPDYTGYIQPMQLRRMSKAVRIGIGASKIAMQQAGIDKPGALSLGTAMGCMQDTEVFLNKMITQDEQMLTPTSFIQSTHNTVGGQIALLAGCHGHNLTFVHRGHSFEHAVVNAALYLEERTGKQVLIGGIDEMTPLSLQVMQQAGVYNNVTAGEGATFFIASDKAEAGAIQVKDVSFFMTEDGAEAMQKVNGFVQRNKLDKGVDLLLSGATKDERTQTYYELLETEIAADATVRFKELCGEYGTASAFAVGLACEAVKDNAVLTGLTPRTPVQLKKILIVNNYLHYCSCWYLEVV